MTRSTLMAMFGYGALAAVLLACLYLISLFAAVVARIKKDGESLARTRILRPRVRLAGHQVRISPFSALPRGATLDIRRARIIGQA